MKKLISAFALLVAAQMQAQTLYVNNSNQTYQQINTTEVEQITFDEEQQLISIEMQGGITSRFATADIDSISSNKKGDTALTYSSDKSVTFDAADASSFNEVVETIITDETIEEAGDFVENFSTSKVIAIVFSETGVTCQPTVDGVTVTQNGNHVVINSTLSKMGYVVRGTCSNGSLKIYSTKKFKLQLAQLTLTNPTGPAINIQSGKTVYMVVSGVNSLCDGATYSTAATTANGTLEDQKGTLFSEGQLIFSGGGTLNVTSYGGHGICSDDYIRIRNAKINVNAVKDGFNTNDLFRVGRTADASPVITVTASGNGIDCGKGQVIIEAGTVELNTVGEAIKVEYEGTSTTITPDAIINGGYIKAVTSGDKSSIIKTTGNYTQNGGIIHGETSGNGSKIINCNGDLTLTAGKVVGVSSGSLSSDTTAAGGFKCDGALTISGGTVAIDCTGRGSKGFNLNGSATINGGNITLLATDENFVGEGYDRKTRAITAMDIVVNGGYIFTKAYDHAINANSLTFANGTINAFSTASTALQGNVTQKSGWLLMQDAE